MRYKSEIKRINAIPLKKIPAAARLVKHYTDKYKTPTGAYSLRAHQAQALYEAEHSPGGGIVVAGVGAGKSMLLYLLPRALKAKRPLILLPASAEKDIRTLHDEYRDHFEAPESLFLTYELLSRDIDDRLLESYAPDLILADEMHALSNYGHGSRKGAGCVIKLQRHLSKHYPLPFWGFTATPWKTSLTDCQHLFAFAKDMDSPLPLDRDVCNAWSQAEFPKGDDNPQEARQLAGLDKLKLPVMQRISRTPNVLWLDNFFRETPLTLRVVDGTTSSEVEELLAYLEAGLLPEGDIAASESEVWRTRQELSLGYYSRFVEPPPHWWVEARSAYTKAFQRSMCDTHRQFDTRNKNSPVVQAWKIARSTFQPESEPVWKDKNSPAMTYAVEYLAKNQSGLVWVPFVPAAERIAELAGVPCFGEGQGKGGKPHIMTHKGPAVVTFEANKESKNLQAWKDNLFLCPPSKSYRLEQAIGRTHRSGQKHPVTATFYCALPQQRADVFKAVNDARQQERVTGIPQKMSWGSIEAEAEERK